MRAFICVDLDEKAKGEIKNILNKLDGDLTANFVKPGNLHLTFKFLGDITEEDAERIKKALSKINFRKFKVKLGKIGAFPSLKYIRVLWVDLENGELKELQKQIDTSLNGLFPMENGFSSHVTMARVKAIKNKEAFLQKLDKIKIEPVEFEINRVCFKKSDLTSGGPVYENLFILDLK